MTSRYCLDGKGSVTRIGGNACVITLQSRAWYLINTTMQYPTVKFCTVTESRITLHAFADVSFLKITASGQYCENEHRHLPCYNSHVPPRKLQFFMATCKHRYTVMFNVSCMKTGVCIEQIKNNII